MLRSLHIISLFGIYTYTIDFADSQGKGLKFITSPNGYGKTTLLNLIHAFYSQNWSLFLQTPFKSITYTLDECVIRITRLQNNEEEENSDEEPGYDKYMEVTILSADGQSPIESIRYDLEKETKEQERHKQASNSLLQMYSNIQPCYFIHDNRLHITNTPLLITEANSKEQTSITADAEDLTVKLAETRNGISQMTTDLEFTVSISREEYQSATKELAEFNALLMKYGLMEKNLITDYQEDNALYLGALIKALRAAQKKYGSFVQKLALFERIIIRSELAYKQMEIHPRYGYRFIAENKERTILRSDTLSSGEQHLIIMTYELLFKAPEESLILLDEPELSFHFLWQSNFLNNLQDIRELRPRLQWIICTHSPQIFGRKWDLSVDLYELQQHKDSVE